MPFLSRVAVALAACLLAPAASAQSVPKAVLDAAKEFAGECGAKPQSMISTAKLTGGNKPDYVIQSDKDGCQSFCGTAGCAIEIWAPTAKGWTRAYSDNVLEWKPRADSKPGVELTHSGGFCDRPESESCTETLSWDKKSATLR